MAANSRASESSVLPTLSRRCLLASVADHALLDDAPTLLPWTITTAVVLPEVTALVEMDMATATAVRDATTTTTVLAIDPHLVVLWKTILPLLLAVDTMIHTDATTLLPRRILTPMGDPHTTDLPEISLPPERVDTHETVAILETMIVLDVTDLPQPNMPIGVEQSRPINRYERARFKGSNDWQTSATMYDDRLVTFSTTKRMRQIGLASGARACRMYMSMTTGKSPRLQRLLGNLSYSV
jgi:hypothetical protein